MIHHPSSTISSKHIASLAAFLPNSVKSYSLSPDDGSFVVELEKSFYIQFDYLAYYDTKINDNLKVGPITNLDGFKVKRFLFWFDVDEISVDLRSSDNIYITVGFVWTCDGKSWKSGRSEEAATGWR